MSSAIRSRMAAVGVGFLLNSTSSVPNWSCVALCRFWFFCCWVRVLFRGGRREPGVPAGAVRGGEGVEIEVEVDMMSKVLGDCICTVDALMV